MVRQIPNLFTLLNLIFGTLAIIFILQADLVKSYDDMGRWEVSFQYPENFVLAAVCILCAAVIDFLDGFLARWLKASSEMGKQLDSLCDAVSFGVAPACVVYQLLRFSYMREQGGLDTSFLPLLPSLAVAACAVWRLAKFNIDTRQSISFRGVPTPITAILFFSLPMMWWFHGDLVSEIISNKWVLYAMIVVAGYMMVSDLPIMSLKLSGGIWRNYIPQLILLILSIILLIVLQWMAVPFIYILYVSLSLIFRKQIISIKS
jgi:CDP-diacylglycerol--serine O-phosphatidyltransferase